MWFFGTPLIKVQLVVDHLFGCGRTDRPTKDCDAGEGRFARRLEEARP
jgi:hypothetical protein